MLSDNPVPAPQFHLTFGSLLSDNDRIPKSLRQACKAEPVYVRLGSIFHDLPYYGNMLAEAIRYGLKSQPIDAPWAYRMHSVRPDRFVASFVRAAHAADLARDEKLALIAGLISHCALDLTLHPLVNHCARRDAAIDGGHETFHHRITEKYHSLFFHVDRMGDDSIGTSTILKQTHVVKDGSLFRYRAHVEPQIAGFMRDAYRGVYGDAPDVERWAGWVQSFRHFGIMVASPMARRNSLKVRRDPKLRARYFESTDFRFYEFYAASERRVIELGTLAYDYFEAGDFSKTAEGRFVRAARIDDLAEPTPQAIDRLPSLPSLDRGAKVLPLRLTIPRIFGGRGRRAAALGRA